MKRKIYILGVGKSGYWAAMLALKEGYEQVVVCDEDERNLNVLNNIRKLKGKGVSCVLGEDVCRTIPENKDLIVVSPGIDLRKVCFRNFLKNNPKIISEIEFASWFAKGSFIGVTGTNGKTTVCRMIEHIFKKNGIDCAVAGNIGYPLSKYVVESNNHKIVVLELSSFQLERTYNVFLDAGILLNITQDHIDRHGNFENYVAAKIKIVDLINSNGFLVVNENVFKYIKNTGVYISIFSENGISSNNSTIFIKDNKQIILEKNGYFSVFNFFDYKFFGRHNFNNAVFSAVVCKKFGVNEDDAFASLKDFMLPEHRLEVFYKKNGVIFVNDSKSTTPDSLIAAVYSFDDDIYLIAGGMGKESDFSVLSRLKDSKIKKVYLIGESKSLIASVLNNYFDVYMFDSLKEAVEKALFDSRNGGVVLFSPGCASFDMFANYEERGNLFKKEVITKLVA